MVRMQVHLKTSQLRGLATLAATTGKRRSVLIREAVDHMLMATSKQQRRASITATAGLWKDRTDLPDFDALRRSWDRS